MIGIAAAMGVWALTEALVLGRPLVDPEGSFLGPSWLRLPLLLGGAVLIDLVPRTLWKSRMRPSEMKPVLRDRLRTHWTRERLVLVFLGIACFYVTYVCYRNLKSYLPFMNDTLYDRELHLLDRALLFGHDPAILLHNLLGTTVAAWGLSYVYLWFLPLVPIAVTIWVVWSRNLSYGYWFVTAQCIAWTLGTVSYYALPTLGPGLEYVSVYADLTPTPTSSLMESLVNSRQGVLLGGITGQVQSVAGFASLHCGITLLVALMVQYTVNSRPLRIFFWCNFAVTVVATLYFGWHYIADDVAGMTLALVSFYVAGLATGQRFDHGGLTSHPTTTTSKIPVDHD
ncbi:inositol phosphorylceramide synthase [Nocardioides sp. GY 10127]|nr:inositol phosphorylceramide synthase [Nocardioides sp. GY 10127]